MKKASHLPFDYMSVLVLPQKDFMKGSLCLYSYVLQDALLERQEMLKL